ncbi:MAG: glycosyltransferase [Armatimonadetes bacterium]|nr:glycosyltransferase [Armatimonadota bacterium]
MGKVVVMVTMSLWDEPHRGRHHYASLLSQQHTVIWLNRHLRRGEKWDGPRVETVSSGLYVIHPGRVLLPPRVDLRINMSNWFRLAALRRGLRMLSIRNPDVIWCYDYQGLPFFRFYRDKSLLLYFCNDWFGEYAYTRYESRLVSLADYVIAVSPKLRDSFKELNANAHCVMHGLWQASEPPKYIRKTAPETFAYVGTLNNTVDVEFLERIIRETDGRLVLGGPVVEASSVQRKAFQKLLASERVTYLGNLGKDDAYQAMCRADMLLLPYAKGRIRGQTYPIKYFEYLGCGRPILATDFQEWPPAFPGTYTVYREGDSLSQRVAEAYSRWDESSFAYFLELAGRSTWAHRLAEVSGIIGVEL